MRRPSWLSFLLVTACFGCFASFANSQGAPATPGLTPPEIQSPSAGQDPAEGASGRRDASQPDSLLPIDPESQGAVPIKEDAPVDPDAVSSGEALQAILDSIQDKEEGELAQAQQAVAEAKDPVVAEQAAERVRVIQAEVDALREKFQAIASGVDPEDLIDPEEGEFNLQTELVTLLRPLVQQLKDATAEPREIDQLRSRIALCNQRISLAQVAADNLDRAASNAEPGSVLAERLNAARDKWRAKKTEYLRDKQVAAHELETKLKGRKSLVESTGSLFSGFFRSRGFNFLLSIGAFFGVFLVMRFVRARVLRVVFSRRASFYSRLAGVILHTLAFLMGILAMILVLFNVSDWVLLVLVLIFLVGLGWASVNMLPQFFEQVRLVLNLGSVRENERVTFEGLSWRVDALKVYTILRNPELTGGVYRIPVQSLLGLHSRPLGENEIWFPCREGEWVILSDGVFGQVHHQSPEMVRLVEPGGGQRTYPTSAFLGLSPLNLSHGFRLRLTFGVDYSHQAIATREIPELMRAKLRRDLLELVRDEEIAGLQVELAVAGASSLDYAVLLDLNGSAASKYQQLRRALSRILVDACNENDWVIPFTQVTLHQAS